MATNTDQIVTQLVADTRKFDGAMNGSIEVIKRFNKAGEEIGSRVKVLTHHMDEAGKKTDGLRAAMTRLSRDIKVTNTIVDTFGTNIKRAYDAAAEGSKIMAAEAFFKNAGKSIEDYRKATSGMVSDAELMKKANLADSMGINEETFKKLVMVAEASALKTGQSFDYMFNSIIVGTARSSRLLLDNLGIIVSVGQANETYAAKVGKAVDALSAEEKQLAFVEEVARRSQGTLDEYAQVTDRTAESFARFDASMQNTVDTIKVGLAKVIAEFLPGLTSFFDDVKSLVESQNWAALGEYMGLRLVEGLAGALKVGGSDLWRKWMDETIANVRKEADALVALGKFKEIDAKYDKQDDLVKLIGAFRKQTGGDAFYSREQILADVAGMSKDTLDAMRKAGEGALAGLIEAIKETAQALGVLPKALSVSTGAPNAGGGGRWDGTHLRLRVAELDWEDKAFKAVRDSRRDDAKDAAKLANEIWEDEVKALKKKQEQELDWTLKAIDREADARRAVFREQERMQRKIAEQERRRYAELMNVISQTSGAIASGSGMFGPALSEAGSMVGATVGGPVGAIIGGLLPALGAVIDKLSPVVDFLSAVVKGIELLVSNALSQLLEILIPLGPALTALLGAVGNLVGIIIAPLASVLKVVTTLIGGLIGVIATAVTIFATLVQILSGLGQILFFIATGHQVGFALEQLATHLENASNGIDEFIYAMLEAVATFNNGLVKWIRASVPGMENFGRLMFAAQFGLGDDKDPINENTSALEENTAALRDFVREFRNLPQNYKAGAAIYDAQNPESRYRPGLNRDGIGSRMVPGFTNGRWRT